MSEHIFSKNIFILVESNAVEGYIIIINSLEKEIDMDAVIKVVGVTQNIFQGYGAKKTITILSGLSFPISYLTEIRENAEYQHKARIGSREESQTLRMLELNEPKQQVKKPDEKPKMSRLDMLRRLKAKK